MKNIAKTILILALIAVYIIGMLSFISPVSVSADYIILYPGDQGNVKVKVENNENFDMKDISISLVLSSVSSTGTVTSLPFNVIGSSSKDLDDLDNGDDDSATFTIKASTEITPGDYNIPYVVTYINKDTSSTKQEQGTFGIRVSAKTDLDFGVESTNNIIWQQGKITLEIINRGLGDIKSVSVEVTPEGYDLISKEKIFVGTINAEDSDTASWDILFTDQNAELNAKITYNDFDNNKQTKMINLPIQVYTQQEALDLGLIQKSHTTLYFVIVILLVIIWFIYRRIRKARKKRAKEAGR